MELQLPSLPPSLRVKTGPSSGLPQERLCGLEKRPQARLSPRAAAPRELSVANIRRNPFLCSYKLSFHLQTLRIAVTPFLTAGLSLSTQRTAIRLPVCEF